MGYKIYLSQAQHGTDRTACAICKSENGHSNLMVDTLTPLLKSNKIDFKKALNNPGGLTNQCNESDAWGADIHMPIHSNACPKGKEGQARGIRIITSSNDTAVKWGKQLAESFNRVLADYDGPKAKQVLDTGNLMEINKPKAATLYCEMFFHDNAEDMHYYHSHMKQCAEAIGRFMCELDGKSFVDQSVPAPAPSPKPQPAPQPVPAPKPTPTLAKLIPGDRVRYKGRLYATSTGGGAGKTVDGTYVVTNILAGRSHGILLNDGLGWVSEAACTKL